MNGLFAVVRREINASLSTPLAWLFLMVFLVAAGASTFFLGDFFPRGQADLGALFEYVPWLLLVLVPAASMRLWAEERRDGTAEMLLALPLRPWVAVLGKYLAAWLFIALALALTFPLWLTVNYLGHPDNAAILVAYLGSLVLGGALLAVGTCMSVLTRHQAVAYVLSLLIGLLYLLGGLPQVSAELAPLLPAALDGALRQLGMLGRFQHVAHGVLDPADAVFFVATIVIWLAAAVLLLRVLESEK